MWRCLGPGWQLQPTLLIATGAAIDNVQKTSRQGKKLRARGLFYIQGIVNTVPGSSQKWCVEKIRSVIFARSGQQLSISNLTSFLSTSLTVKRMGWQDDIVIVSYSICPRYTTPVHWTVVQFIQNPFSLNLVFSMELWLNDGKSCLHIVIPVTYSPQAPDLGSKNEFIAAIYPF